MANFLSQEEIDALLDIATADDEFEYQEPIIESKERSYIRGLLESQAFSLDDNMTNMPSIYNRLNLCINDEVSTLKGLIHARDELRKFKEIEPECFI